MQWCESCSLRAPLLLAIAMQGGECRAAPHLLDLVRKGIWRQRLKLNSPVSSRAHPLGPSRSDPFGFSRPNGFYYRRATRSVSVHAP
jgi:hypothetical protein